MSNVTMQKLSISPLDDRYASQMEDVGESFSEKALMR